MRCYYSRVEDFSRIREAVNRNKADFLKTDLDTGLTFADIASNAGDNSEKKRRNQNNARQAYDTVLRLLKHVVLNDTEGREIYDRLSRLKIALQALGEML